MDVVIIVDKPKAVAPLGKAQVKVVIHEMEFHPLGPLYFIPWRHEMQVVHQSA
jgi:ureidoglycolate hydrolase